jgi:hypothetical protein
MDAEAFDRTIALWLVDAAILITLIEGVALAWWHRRSGAGVAPRRLWCNLAAGLALMAALRAALAGFGWPWVAAGLMLAGVAHTLDQVERWRRAAPERARREIDEAPPPALEATTRTRPAPPAV